MFDFKRLKELLRNAIKVSNDKKLSLSGQCSVSYSKHLLSNHTLTEFSISSLGCYLHLQVLVCWHDCAKYFCDVMCVPSLYTDVVLFFRSFFSKTLAGAQE